MPWHLTPGHDLKLRFWGGACMVHHRASNQTCRLSAGAGQLLDVLREHGPLTVEALVARFDGLSPAEAEALLASLQALLLVERRP